LKKKTAKNRWFLAYTLIKNEELITLRWHRRKLRWKQEEIERKKADAKAEKLKRNSFVRSVKRTLSNFIKPNRSPSRNSVEPVDGAMNGEIFSDNFTEKSSITSSLNDIDVKTKVKDNSPNHAQNNETEF